MEEKEKIKGHKHILSQVIRDCVNIFTELGFTVADGPEVETEHYNFDALNVPKDHPARDMWDTFWLADDKGLLRTHTSPVQVRYMEKNKPPLAIIAPGKVFRYEATDATHEAQFYQLEGLMIDKTISLANMKAILEFFLTKFFRAEVTIRLRPSYFPFVEPGSEIDMSCFRCKGNGYGSTGESCNVCKTTGWIEIMGAGMVQPSVLNGVGINPRDWQGFAFGVGIDRIAMLKYGVPDVRLFYGGDLRFIEQF